MPLSFIPDPPDAPPPDPEASRCRLFGPAALIVQGLMGVFVILSLVIKRQLEKKRRPWRIWTWDVGKQLVGQGVIHLLNLLISDLVAHAVDNNPCSLYFLNILIDTTFGVAIFYFILKGLTWYVSNRLGFEGYTSGDYGHPPNPLFWWRQLVPYLISIVVMKLLVLLPLTLPGIAPIIIRIGQGMLSHLPPNVQVIFVMAVFPVIMNVVQFCIVDQVIKAGQVEHDEAYEPLPTEHEDHIENHDDDVEANPSLVRRRHSAIPGTPVLASSHSTRSPSMPPTPLAPNSPLLNPIDDKKAKGGYGSTTPSPRPSLSLEPGQSFWSNLLRRDPQQRDPAVSGSRAARSDAPSPDSCRPRELPTPSPLTSSSALPDSAQDWMTGSHLSEEAQKDARRNLSPTLHQGHAEEEGEEMDPVNPKT